MARKRISREKIINAFLFSSFDKSAGATSLQDISDFLQIKKASLYNHFSSRDEMYEATLEYCRVYLAAVNFLPEELKDQEKLAKETAASSFRKIIRRYLKLYEAEPLFQMYAFIHAEQYFNKMAAAIADDERCKVEKGTSEILKYFSDSKKTVKLSAAEIRSAAQWYSSALIQQIDVYIMHKKEIVRQNPECGAGSLFALPTDDSALSSIIKLSDNYIKLIAGTL